MDVKLRPARRVALGPGVEAVLSRYRPDERQARHCHAVHELTVILAGDLGETIGSRSYDCAAGWAAFKPAGADHADAWGRRGALIFSLKVATEVFPSEPAAGWRRPAGRAHLSLIRSCLAGTIGGDDAVTDLAAALQRPLAPPRAPPPWLATARERLRAEPQAAGVAELADAGGVSRTHFSAAFQQHYGVAPSVFRRQVLTAEALRLALDDGAAFAQAACDAGFADQSHMSRTVSAMTGLAPDALRRALAA